MRNLTIPLLVLLAGCVSTTPETPPNMRVSEQYIEHPFDGRKWALGYQDGNMTELVAEWIPNGQSMNNWTEMVTAYISYQNVDIHAMVKGTQDGLARGSRNFRTRILAEEPKAVVFEWSHQGNGRQPAQREIKKIMKGKDGIYTISYTVLEGSFSGPRYEQWKRNIMAAQLFPRKR